LTCPVSSPNQLVALSGTEGIGEMSKVGVAEFAPLSDSDDGKPTGTQHEREKSSLRDDWEQPDRNMGKMKSVTGTDIAVHAERYAPESVKGFSAARASAAATAELADDAFMRGGKLVTNWGYEEVGRGY
jgi:hypothetical protein